MKAWRKRSMLASLVTLWTVGCAGESPVVGTTEDRSNPATSDEEGGEMVESFVDQIVLPNDPDRCLPRPLPLRPGGEANCAIVGVATEEGTCDCNGPGRGPVDPALRNAILARLIELAICGGESGSDCNDQCLCDVAQATEADRASCLEEDPASEAAIGWCYLDPARGVGSEDLVSQCPPDEERRIRFLGDVIRETELLFLACSGSTGPSVGTKLGSVCTPSAESDPTFGGFYAPRASVDLGADSCKSGVCLVNHFQGRVSCPYGQDDDPSTDVPDMGSCKVPGSNVPIASEVKPQLVRRPPNTTSTCSCLCDGPGPGPFCKCPESTTCRPALESLGLPGEEAYVGSYCIPKGGEFEGLPSVSGPTCSLDAKNCSDR